MECEFIPVLSESLFWDPRDLGHVIQPAAVPLSSVPLFLSERKRGRGKKWDIITLKGKLITLLKNRGRPRKLDHVKK
jgi:hypothetical protein